MHTYRYGKIAFISSCMHIDMNKIIFDSSCMHIDINKIASNSSCVYMNKNKNVLYPSRHHINNKTIQGVWVCAQFSRPISD